MSIEDGLVMQLHAGSVRNHNEPVHARFGPDAGADIPVATEWTRSLVPCWPCSTNGATTRASARPVSLDEAAYSRSSRPSPGTTRRCSSGRRGGSTTARKGCAATSTEVIETAGLYNTAGFNDDTRAFASIPSRHDVWRRVTCDWVAGLLTTGLVDEEDALEMVRELAYGLATKGLPDRRGVREVLLDDADRRLVRPLRAGGYRNRGTACLAARWPEGWLQPGQGSASWDVARSPPRMSL